MDMGGHVIPLFLHEDEIELQLNYSQVSVCLILQFYLIFITSLRDKYEILKSEI